MVYECRAIERFYPEQMKRLAANSIYVFDVTDPNKIRIKIGHLYTPIWRKRPLNYFSDCEFN